MNLDSSLYTKYLDQVRWGGRRIGKDEELSIKSTSLNNYSINNSILFYSIPFFLSFFLYNPCVVSNDNLIFTQLLS